MPGELMDNVHSNDENFDVNYGINTHNDVPNGPTSSAPRMSPLLIGVVLVDERIVHTNKVNFSDHVYNLGVIILENVDIDVEELRRILKSQIPSLPGTFCILTKQGWPIQSLQESKVHISHVIKKNNTVMIKKHFALDHAQVGVITATGDCLGFIFIDFHFTIFQAREAINEQLTETRRYRYRFLERNGWPVSVTQENFLSVFDIMRQGQHICIQYDDRDSSLDPPGLTPIELPVVTPSREGPSVQKPKQGKKIVQLTRNKFGSLKKKNNYLVAKPILISYVRAEAAQHALDLKEELEKQECSVYLDVHEIKTGSDWQDALNYAVSHCIFFVPLVTPMYGKTQWTNREVKLADVLNKNIIPISFIEQWPPECLAIQFASTQYIPWRPEETEQSRKDIDYKPPDPRVWDPVHVKRVCKELTERCKNAMKKTSDNEKSREAQNSAVRSETATASKDINRKMIVISAHPKQKVLTHELKVSLEADGYDVWCSSDVQDGQDVVDDISPCSAATPRELASIPEGESVFSKAYQEISNTIADSKRSMIPRHDSEGQGERRQLTRMISQVSDISLVSSLTPEKMERLATFQRKTDGAGVVIIIVSEAYTKSKTSQQQVFYCEHRKQIVLVKFDQVQVPSWFTVLVGNDMITNVQTSQFMTTLKAQVKRALNPSTSETPKDATAEAKIQCMVNCMKKLFTQPETCLYIAGSSKFQNPRSEEIAKALGRELAKVKNITVCTGGFFGAPDVVAKSFYKAVESNRESRQPTAETKDREPVVHLLPFKDSKNFTVKARQNLDGSFEAVPYGKTYFAGDSVKERETAVARLFDTCIVIEGGPGAAHEVEEFIWNDHFVIPIISTGGAAGGQYGVPLKIFEPPPCVSRDDWDLLSDKEAKPEEVAEAVVNIVVAIKKSIVTHISSQVPLTTDNNQKSKNKLRIKSKKAKAQKDQDHSLSWQVIQRDETAQPAMDFTFPKHKLLERKFATDSVDGSAQGANNTWQRFCRLFCTSKVR